MDKIGILTQPLTADEIEWKIIAVSILFEVSHFSVYH